MTTISFESGLEFWLSIPIVETCTERDLDVCIGSLEIGSSEIGSLGIGSSEIEVIVDLSAITFARGASEVSTDSSIQSFGPLNWSSSTPKDILVFCINCLKVSVSFKSDISRRRMFVTIDHFVTYSQIVTGSFMIVTNFEIATRVSRTCRHRKYVRVKSKLTLIFNHNTQPQVARFNFVMYMCYEVEILSKILTFVTKFLEMSPCLNLSRTYCHELTLDRLFGIMLQLHQLFNS